MTDTVLSPQQVADFLRDNPDFFATHADVFATMRVPHPHGSGTISLGERQILTLRERNREQEWRLNELIHNANVNEGISNRLMQWCARLLGETEIERIPGEIALGLAREFDLNEVGLRLWRLPNLPEGGYGEPVSEDVRTFADSLKSPYCGRDTEFEAASWLSAKPRSLALIPLRPGAEAPTVGLLVLGSNDPDRFAPDMSTTFLDTVGKLASAALRRMA
ncbi:DUF484 family protein [Bordetella genomosp. 9]|uniref:DUF484 domain-containing protein n=1 Tax=Bordetella genomosp. 9 TaxID=1416803 RepID=A0A1W6Z4E8_9BORD|nr:DUF484 family protein [Bordetella genomosp. 9]ARP88232.1 hypothetical protein CAL13_19960 [Bordetella genomosp. 9]ARP92196.1 hypothetical protein CAL14_19490 [Bordetella genomosp. 9]